MSGCGSRLSSDVSRRAERAREPSENRPSCSARGGSASGGVTRGRAQPLGTSHATRTRTYTTHGHVVRRSRSAAPPRRVATLSLRVSKQLHACIAMSRPVRRPGSCVTSVRYVVRVPTVACDYRTSCCMFTLRLMVTVRYLRIRSIQYTVVARRGVPATGTPRDTEPNGTRTIADLRLEVGSTDRTTVYASAARRSPSGLPSRSDCALFAAAGRGAGGRGGGAALPAGLGAGAFTIQHGDTERERAMRAAFIS